MGRIGRRWGWVVGVAGAVLVAGSPAEAAGVRVEFSACRTILEALHTDWRATEALYGAGFGQYELNPVVRAVGPRPYFAAWVFATGTLCRETSAWRWASVAMFGVQTWAVNTHISQPWARYYTGSPPMIYLTLRW